MSWESAFSDDDTTPPGGSKRYGLMTYSDNSRSRRCAWLGKRIHSVAWRILSAVLPVGYTGKADSSFATDAKIVRCVDDLEACIQQGRTIKAGGPIDVCRTTWRGRDVVIKWYKHVGWMHSLRHTLKGSRARRAWVNGRRLPGLNVPTPRPLAFLDEHRGPFLWQSYLITEYVDAPILYSVLRDERVPAGRKRRLVHQTLRLIDRLGSRGISHGDMKHTNILCLDSRIMLTDLDGMEVHRLPWLSRQRRGRDIARFLRRMPVWQAPDAEAAPSAACQKQEPAFMRLEHPAGVLWVNRDLRNERLEKALSTGRKGLAEQFRLEPVHAISGSQVSRFMVAFNGIERRVYCKEFVERSALDRLKHLVRPSRAVRDMNASSMLSRRGFQAAQVVLAGEVRTGLLKSTSFLVTLEIADAHPISLYLIQKSDAVGVCSLEERRQLLRQFGQTVGRMHHGNIAHGDLRVGNTLVRRTDGRWEFFFIDNERTRKWFHLPDRLRLRNLVQVNMLPRGISHTDRLRFFQAYLLMNPSVRPRYKRWAKRIMAVTHRRLLFLKRLGRLGETTWRLTPADEHQ